MSAKSLFKWFDDFPGIAYRYYDLRMNVVPLLADMKQSQKAWFDIIYWWIDHSIKIRFVESLDKYWFIMGADSRKPSTNTIFFKILQRSEHYERFKKGYGGEAYLRLGTYTKKSLVDVKGRAMCGCKHEARDHDEGDNDVCLFEDCKCTGFSSFQVNLSKRKKTVTNITFLDENDEDLIKEDPLVWNCLNKYKYSNLE